MEQIQPFVDLLAKDPFFTTVVLGLIWPWIQASLDKPTWTRGARVGLVLTVAIAISVVLWAATAFQWDVETWLAQLSGFLGTAWLVYQILGAIKIGNGNLLDWVGVTTPGGATEMPRLPKIEAISE